MSDALPARWCAARLAELGSVQLGKMLSAKAKTGRGARPYLRNVNVRWHRIDVADVLEMDFDAREVEKYQLLPGDVLVCEGGEPGRAAVWSNQLPGALYQKALHRIRFTGECVDPRYFTYFLELAAVEGLLAKRFTGSTIKHLPRESFLEMPIPVAPAAEQRRIVAVLEEHLSELDAAVAGLERARANSKRLRESILEAVIADGEPAESGRARWSSLGEVAEIQGGIQKQPKRAPVRNHYPFLRVANVLRGRLKLDDVHRIELFGEELERLRLQKGDLLIVEGNGSASEIGRMAVWDGSIENCVHQNHIIRARARAEVLPDFLALYWNSPSGARRVQEAASSTSGLHTLSVSKISKLPVPVPPLSVQRRVVEQTGVTLDGIDVMSGDIDVQLLRATRLRQSILKHAFEGKLVPQDPNDEPASVLLDHIRAERESAAPRAPKSRPKAKPPRKAPHR